MFIRRDASPHRCELKARTLYYTRRDPKSGDSIGFTKKLRLGTRAYEARFTKDEIALRSLALKVTEAMLDVSMIRKKDVQPIEQPKKKAFRTIRKEITLRAADLATAARGPSLEMWWAALAPGCPNDGAWHDITASKEVARHSPQRKSFFSDTDDEDSDAETIVSEASLPADRGSFGSMASLTSAPV